MTKYGYNQVMDKEFADVGIQVSYIESTYYFTNYSSPYWWWDYPGYWVSGLLGRILEQLVLPLYRIV